MKKHLILALVVVITIASLATAMISIGIDADHKNNPTLRVGYNSGDVTLYAGSGTIPSGFLECNGQAVSRSTYALLFSVVGTTYGVGDGSTTFNVPDLRGRFALGVAASGTGSTLGATGGNIDHVHSVNPPNTTSTASANLNNVTLLALGQAAAPSHTHDVDIAAFNSASANPPFLALKFIIKT